MSSFWTRNLCVTATVCACAEFCICQIAYENLCAGVRPTDGSLGCMDVHTQLSFKLNQICASPSTIIAAPPSLQAGVIDSLNAL